ncbi:hypothetical protein ACHWQZ_G006432 [Mnemiopsis leidyi]
MNSEIPSCVILGSNNATFCGVNKTWEPRESLAVNGELAFIGTLIICVGTSIFMFSKLKKSFWLFSSHIEHIPPKKEIFGPEQKALECCTDRRKALKASFALTWFVFPVAYMMYDCLDVLFDFQYFHKLETAKGNLLDNRIVRNRRVNDGILAFAILGYFKIVLICILNGAQCEEMVKKFYKLSNMPKENSKILKESTEDSTMIKSAISVTALIFEDGVELFLEYFYADKYITKSEWLVLLNSTLMAAIATAVAMFTLQEFVSKLCTVIRHVDYDGSDAVYLVMTFPVQIFAMSKVLRAVACWEQAYSGEIPAECLKVEEGALIQTPFTAGCMSALDYGILTLTSLSGVGIIFQVAIIIYAFKCHKED